MYSLRKILHKNGHMTVKALSHRAQMSESAVRSMLKEMERLDWVTKFRSTVDGNIHWQDVRTKQTTLEAQG